MMTSAADTWLSNVCDVVETCIGLHFPVERRDILQRNLALAAMGFGYINTDDFIRWLLVARLKKDEIELLSSYLTVSETYFWREPQVFSALTDNVLPGLIASKKNEERILRIWSAGCSTGEEAYSIAIALHKTIPDLKNWRILILGTDINPKSLGKAVKGIYSQWSFRNCPDWLKTRYFRQVGDQNFEIRPEIRKMVTFASLNLTEAIYPSLANNTQAMDIIFCRNVLMYFTDEVAAKISQNLFHSLNPDGWFIVSSCELSAHVFPQFNPVNFPGAILYRKRQTDFSEPLPNQSAGPGLLVPDITADTVASRFTGNDPDDLPVDFSDNEIAGFAITTPAGGVAMDIRLLANQGHHLEALILCNEGITNDKLAIGLYFLRASILQESGNFIEAISSVKQAVYLDPDFAMGHFMLGNIYQQQGKTRHAKRHFNNVLELLINTNGDDILPESDGLTVNYIREVILAHMQKHPII